MTANEFAAECEAAGITPALALENDNIREALKEKDLAKVRRLLREEF